MKLKEINFFERHVEKIVITVALLVLAFAVYRWGMSAPYKVELANQSVKPGEIDTLIKKEAEQTEAILANSEIHPELAELTIDPVGENFRAEMAQPLMAEPGNPNLARSVLALPWGQPVPGQPELALEPDPRYEPVVPAPTILALEANLRTIHPDALAANEKLDAMFANNEQTELAEVTVTGEFDMLSMVKELMMEPADGDRQPIPEEWWFRKWEIVDVVLERQQQLPNGQWPADDKFEVVPPLPGAISARELPANLDPKDSLDALTAIQEYRVQLIQPAAPDTYGAVWLAPQPKTAEEIAAADEAGKLRQQITEKEKLAETLLKKIQQLQNRGQAAAGGRPSGPTSFEGAELEPRPGRVAPRVQPGGSAAANARQKLIERYNERVAKIQEEIAVLEADYQKLTGEVIQRAPRSRLDMLGPGGAPGYDEFGPGGYSEFEGYPGPGAYPRGVNPRGVDPRMQQPRGAYPQGDPRLQRPGATQQPRPSIGGLPGRQPGVNPEDPNALTEPELTREQAIARLMGGEKVQMWAFDVTAQEGKTYRYRMRVRVINPLYNKQALPGDPKDENYAESQRARNQDLFLITSKPGEWSEPVQVPRMTHAFAVASAPNPRPGQVTFEVWRFSWGEWRTQEFTVRAGDPVGKPKEINIQGVPINVDFSTGRMCLDIDFDFLIKGIGNVPRKATRVLLVDGADVYGVRVDLDKDNEKRKDLQVQASDPLAGR